MGWHNHLMDRLEPLLRGEHISPPPGSPFLMLDGGTQNFKAMAWGTEYLRVTRFPDELPAFVKPGEKQKYIDSWREKCKGFFETQKKHGFMTIGTGKGTEQLCPDPHTNFWITAVVAMRRAAKEAGHADVLELSSWWFRSLLAIYKATMTPDGLPVLPGARCKGLPSTEVGMLIVQTLLKLPYQGVFRRKGDLWEQTYYAAAREVRRLVEEEGDDLGGAAKAEELPKLKFPMQVVRFKGGHLAWCEQAETGFQLQDQFCSWVLCRYVKFRKHSIEFDRNWSKPLPEIHPE